MAKCYLKFLYLLHFKQGEEFGPHSRSKISPSRKNTDTYLLFIRMFSSNSKLYLQVDEHCLENINPIGLHPNPMRAKYKTSKLLYISSDIMYLIEVK